MAHRILTIGLKSGRTIEVQVPDDQTFEELCTELRTHSSNSRHWVTLGSIDGDHRWLDVSEVELVDVRVAGVRSHE